MGSRLLRLETELGSHHGRVPDHGPEDLADGVNLIELVVGDVDLGVLVGVDLVPTARLGARPDPVVSLGGACVWAGGRGGAIEALKGNGGDLKTCQ